MTTMPNHLGWEPGLLAAGYRAVWFDELNRFYLAHERPDLAPHFVKPPNVHDGLPRFASLGSALRNPAHPDHRFALHLASLLLGAPGIETDAYLAFCLSAWGALHFARIHSREAHLKRVTGIGGIFFHAKDPAALQAWYKKHLGIDVQEWGGAAFDWTDADGNPTKGTTAWSIGAAGSDHFAPSKSNFMINYRVENLDALLHALREEGCAVLEKTDDSDYGKFGWVMDPEGNKVELWQPPVGG